MLKCLLMNRHGHDAHDMVMTRLWKRRYPEEAVEDAVTTPLRVVRMSPRGELPSRRQSVVVTFSAPMAENSARTFT